MLGHLNTHLAQLRRDQIQPALKPEYKPICAIEVPENSQYLFGDDIAKQLKDVKETSRISRSEANTSNKKPNGNYRPFRQNDRGGFSNNYCGKSQSRIFFFFFFFFFYGKATPNHSDSGHHRAKGQTANH